MKSVSFLVLNWNGKDVISRCLDATSRALGNYEGPGEIVVVDNNPGSGLTPPVVADFPDVVLVNEPCRGLAYARNAGFVASKGDICIATDDDVRFPPDWLEKLLAPFSQNNVMAVTGNVLPYELKSQAQHLFEEYGGLGRGYERLEANEKWFEKFL